jgi:hypothetical protein
MRVEWWYTIFQFASVGLLVLTLGVTAGAVLTGRILTQRRDERISVANRAAAEANERAAVANEKAEELKADNLALQRTLRPRRLPTSVSGSPELAAKYDALRAFAGTPVAIITVNDVEARVFAGDVWEVLREAGWQMPPNLRFPDGAEGVLEGVIINSGDTAPTPGEEPDRIWQAGNVLVELLNAMFSEMEIGADVPLVNSPGDFTPANWALNARPQGAVLVWIGVRPIAKQRLKHTVRVASDKLDTQ